MYTCMRECFLEPPASSAPSLSRFTPVTTPIICPELRTSYLYMYLFIPIFFVFLRISFS